MKLHFSTSLHELSKHVATYEFIERTIKEDGHSIAREWLKEYKEKKAASPYFTDEEWKNISSETLASIEQADAIIIEASILTYNIGYLSATALARKKPLLMLFNSQPQAYIFDSSNSLRRAEIYHNNEELKYSITNFLKDIDVDTSKLRFNMALDRETYNFLNWESASTGKTKAQIIREMLKEQIGKKP